MAMRLDRVSNYSLSKVGKYVSASPVELKVYGPLAGILIRGREGVVQVISG